MIFYNKCEPYLEPKDYPQAGHIFGQLNALEKLDDRKELFVFAAQYHHRYLHRLFMAVDLLRWSMGLDIADRTVTLAYQVAPAKMLDRIDRMKLGIDFENILAVVPDFTATYEHHGELYDMYGFDGAYLMALVTIYNEIFVSDMHADQIGKLRDMLIFNDFYTFERIVRFTGFDRIAVFDYARLSKVVEGNPEPAAIEFHDDVKNAINSRELNMFGESSWPVIGEMDASKLTAEKIDLELNDSMKQFYATIQASTIPAAKLKSDPVDELTADDLDVWAAREAKAQQITKDNKLIQSVARGEGTTNEILMALCRESLRQADTNNSNATAIVTNSSRITSCEGCITTLGSNCTVSETYARRLAKRLNWLLIALIFDAVAMCLLFVYYFKYFN